MWRCRHRRDGLFADATVAFIIEAVVVVVVADVVVGAVVVVGVVEGVYLNECQRCGDVETGARNGLGAVADVVEHVAGGKLVVAAAGDARFVNFNDVGVLLRFGFEFA